MGSSGGGAGGEEGRGVGLRTLLSVVFAFERPSVRLVCDDLLGPRRSGSGEGAPIGGGRWIPLPKQPGQFMRVGATIVPHCGHRVPPAGPEAGPEWAMFEWRRC
jgi:hypothetical protein